MVKNTAYAWRQMVFYLSLVERASLEEFLAWARAHLSRQGPEFRVRFRPALEGLLRAASGESPERTGSRADDVRVFLGWSKGRHWLLDQP